MYKILKEEIEQITSFFKQQGEQCIKIAVLSDHKSHTKDFNCTIVNSTGKKEKVVVRICLSHTSPHHDYRHCVI